MKPGILAGVLMLASILSRPGMLSAGTPSRSAWLPPEQRTPQGILDNEVVEVTRGYHTRRVIMLLSNPKTGLLEAVASSRGKKILHGWAVRREASGFHFDPGTVVDFFTPRELACCGINNPTRVSASDLLRLFGAVANWGMLMPGNQTVLPEDRVEILKDDLLKMIHGSKNCLLLARVEGIRVAGAAGHGGTYPVTTCFAGYFPADHPRHVCVVVVEGADVLMKYQRGALMAAPIFSFIARKVHCLDKRS